MSTASTTRTINWLAGRVDDLEVENRGLVDDLRRVQADLEGAQAMIRHFQTFYSRTGW